MILVPVSTDAGTALVCSCYSHVLKITVPVIVKKRKLKEMNMYIWSHVNVPYCMRLLRILYIDKATEIIQG